MGYGFVQHDAGRLWRKMTKNGRDLIGPGRGRQVGQYLGNMQRGSGEWYWLQGAEGTPRAGGRAWDYPWRGRRPVSSPADGMHTGPCCEYTRSGLPCGGRGGGSRCGAMCEEDVGLTGAVRMAWRRSEDRSLRLEDLAKRTRTAGRCVPGRLAFVARTDSSARPRAEGGRA